MKSVVRTLVRWAGLKLLAAERADKAAHTAGAHRLGMGGALATLVGLLTVADGAWATCSNFIMGSGTLNAPSTLTVPRDATAGTVIYDTQWQLSGVGQATCQGGETWTMGIPGGATSTNLYRVYQTGVPGIGFKVAYNNNGPNWDIDTTPPSHVLQSGIKYECNPGGWPGGTGCALWSTTYKPGGYFRMQYIALGTPIQSGTSSLPNPIAQVYYGGGLVNQAYFPNSTFVVNVRGCEVTNQNIAVPMKRVRVADFTGAGSKQGPTPFNIPVKCDSGVSVYYQLDGTRPAGVTATNVLTNTATGSDAATGVGIALYKGDSSSNTAQTLAQSVYVGRSTSDGQIMNIPLTAWYFQNSSTRPGPGHVLGLATVTFKYQ
ncbi:fimbrial protein [Pseudomonas sp. PDM20]|uniref:fimbrial protein n=1 Tax=Pseudomonas sp. PDM20 TaxID=2769254 RepID=UPI00177EDFC5|nr:fimbrial protein [Pseudomonas sp. PDM20]MBD9682380.1 fimbrial protein [Pseudomonas sp. PDM20]